MCRGRRRLHRAAKVRCEKFFATRAAAECQSRLDGGRGQLLGAHLQNQPPVRLVVLDEVGQQVVEVIGNGPVALTEDFGAKP